MQYDIQIDAEKQLLRIHASGQRQMAQSLQAWENLLQLCDGHRIDRLLMITEMEGQMHPNELLAYGNRLLELLQDRTLRIAVIDYNQASERDNQLLVTMARNIGLQASLFKDEEEAIRWLCWE